MVSGGFSILLRHGHCPNPCKSQAEAGFHLYFSNGVEFKYLWFLLIQHCFKWVATVYYVQLTLPSAEWYCNTTSWAKWEKTQKRWKTLTREIFPPEKLRWQHQLHQAFQFQVRWWNPVFSNSVCHMQIQVSYFWSNKVNGVLSGNCLFPISLSQESFW